MINQSENLFRIIGIRVLSDCDERLRKILKLGTTYLFCNDFEDDGDEGVLIKKECQPLDKDFFRSIIGGKIIIRKIWVRQLAI